MRIDIKGVIVRNDDAVFYDWFGYDHTCPRDVAEKIAKAAEDENIDVYINSSGGDIFAGSEIYSTLRGVKDLNIHVTGLAASAASVIMCAGPSEIEPTAMVMIHNVWSEARGDHRAMEKEAEILRKCDEAVSAAYQLKTGRTANELKELMESETWMTAADAVSYGFCDRVRADPVDSLGQSAWQSSDCSITAGRLPAASISSSGTLPIARGTTITGTQVTEIKKEELSAMFAANEAKKARIQAEKVKLYHMKLRSEKIRLEILKNGGKNAEKNLS